MTRSTTRRLAAAALVAQPLFIAAWIVAGALQPRYSHAHAAVSELGARTAAHPWIVNAALVVLGLSFVALALALVHVLPRRRAATVAVLLFAGAGVAMALTGPINLDCGFAQRHCRDLWDHGVRSWHASAHVWLAFGAQVLLTLTPFALAQALRPSPAAAAALSAGLVGVGIGLVSHPVYGTGSSGLIQRVDLLVLHIWVVIVAGGVLYATRAAPRPGELVPLRPRDFMANEWHGEGELLLRPLFLGRLFPQRFEAKRTTTSISDKLWRVDDEAGFGGGRVQLRQTYVEWVSDEHLRLTANDLPDGADMWIEEDGYRMAPFRMAFPIGPLPVLIRVHDTSYVADDGTFVNQFDARDLVFGVPVARMLFRVRPVTAGYSRASASDAPPASSEASPAPG